MSFTALHCHSVFSFHAGVTPVHELVSRAQKLGMKSLALTDCDRVSGLILFYLQCRKAGIKPILGVELSEPGKPDETVVLLAKNATGYGDLCEITSERHLHEASFSFSQVFSRPWPNLFLLTTSAEILAMLSHTCNRGNVYGELINQCRRTRERSLVLEKKAGELGIPLVVSNDAYFLDREEWEVHRVLRAIGLVSTISRLREGEVASPEAYLKPGAEMRNVFPRHGEAVDNSGKIAAACDVELKLDEWIMPEIGVPEGFTPASYLEKLAGEGLLQNYGESEHYQRAADIQRMELEVIGKLGYPSYFLMVRQIRDWANEKLHGGFRRLRDCSILRGSAANSITFYNLGVSDLDPIRYDLYFQRFLNEDRASPPDADLDFGWDEREQVLDYMSQTWGQDRVAMVCTTNHFRYRAAFRETAKVYGYTEEQVTKLLDSWKTFSRRIDDPEIQFLLGLAGKIEGKPRFLGQHPGGVLVTNDPIWRHVACQYSGGIKNRVITQIDMHNGLDELGLIKFDILGNGSLSVLRDTLQQIRDQGLPDPQVFDLEKCYHDPRVREIIAKGRTKGIFYIESPAQTRLNKKARAESFEEITITSSLVRPAGSAYIKTFVERHRQQKMGIKEWEFIHPSLEPILGESHDVCAFQEDVTKICHLVAGLSYKQADRIRKMMNSLHEGTLSTDEYKQTVAEFLSGCIKTSGLSMAQAIELWERVNSFTGFSFCKSHSASYAQLSFKCTYLKAYYPAQFFSAVISNNHGFYTTDVYLDEARRWGIRILPMDINESTIKYYGKHNWLRPGLMHLRNLSQKGMDHIMNERERHGRFYNLPDFLRRVDVGQKEVEHLILVGAFDGFGLTRPELLFLLDGIYDQRRAAQPTLFAAENKYSQRQLHPGLVDYSLMEKCLQELKLLGFMLTANMVDILDLHPAAKQAVLAGRLPQYKGKQIKVFGRRVTDRIHRVMNSGRPMMFLTIEDKSEYVDVIFWPDTFERFADEILKPGPYEIWGTVNEDWDTYSLVADRVRAVEWFPNQVDFTLASRRLEESVRRSFTYADIRDNLAG